MPIYLACHQIIVTIVCLEAFAAGRYKKAEPSGSAFFMGDALALLLVQARQ